jgi:hypothetical protein
MVSLTYHDEHVAWQQRLQKEINESFKSHSKSPATTYKDLPRPCFSPPKPRTSHSNSFQNPRSKSNFYTNLPSANINLGTLNVYAEVRGKYSRNANKTLNSFPQVSGLVTRPSTSGSLQGYSKKDHPSESKTKDVLESPKKNRPLVQENRVKFVLGLKEREKNEGSLKSELKVQEKDLGQGGTKEIVKNHLELDGDMENLDLNKDEEIGKGDCEVEEDLDRRTEDSLKTTSSKIRYIEELERLLREERIRRIQAEEKLQKISPSHRRLDDN